MPFRSEARQGAASLPGLTKRRGLTLSLTGSAVANVLPLGGAAGTALNFAMIRRWGFSPGAFGGFLAVTTLLNVVSKLGVIALALGLIPVLHSGHAFGPASLLFLPVPLAVLAGVWILADARTAAGVGGVLDKVLGVFRRTQLKRRLPNLRLLILRLMRDGWQSMTLGMVAYLALQLALLWLCFSVLHVPLGIPVLFTALAVERLLTPVPITPGSAGVVEVGTTAALVALGGDPAGVAGGLLLFRGFTYLMEIRVGGIELQVHDLAVQVIRAGHDVTVFTITEGASAAGDVPVVRLPALAGVPLPAAVDRLRVALRNFEVGHCHSSLVSPLAWHAARLSDNPLLTLHSLPSSSTPWPVAQIDRYVGNVQWTAVSETVTRVLQKHLPRRPIGVLHNGVDPAQWRQPRRTDRPLTIVSTMRLARRKRPMAMLPILEQIRSGVPRRVPLRVVLVGDGPRAAAVAKAVRCRGLADWVELPGRLTRFEIQQLGASAETYLAPAELESLAVEDPGIQLGHGPSNDVDERSRTAPGGVLGTARSQPSVLSRASTACFSAAGLLVSRLLM